ncbi:MAG: sugar ABC transporter ATP-binding protein [Treponema sp.]|jgi:ABC-type sugar transport system ATPase subunit|nr:sugar ABC transporter ATP-binding protein [Treponema sp.]
MSAEPKQILKAAGISKTFGKSRVLKSVDFDIFPGEVHALIGENGAGKSTLLKILFGLYSMDSGEGALYIDGKSVSFESPRDAIDYGIAMIHQEPLVFKDLNIIENFFIGYINEKVVNWRSLEKTAAALANDIGLNAPLKQKMERLSVAEQQLVEIGAALVSNARIIFMDEPTASLTPNEVENLLGMIKRLKGEGRSIVYISHRLGEIKAIADRITVMRDGAVVGTHPNSDLSHDNMIRLMLGHELTLTRKNKQINKKAEPYFRAEAIGIPGIFDNVSFSVGKGEILGIAGLMGSGRTEVARALFGVTPVKRGRLLINGVPVKINSPNEAVRHGIVLLPEDRQALSLFLKQTIAFNATFLVPDRISDRGGWINRGREEALTEEGCGRLRTKYAGAQQYVEELSGGNQQKIGIAKLIATNPEILILDEPTRGIDIGAKEEVYKIIERLSEEGKCIIMISSETAEILALSDKVMVMYEGRPAAMIPGEELNEVNILSAAHDLAV